MKGRKFDGVWGSLLGTGSSVLQRPELGRNKKGEQVGVACRRFCHCVWSGRKNRNIWAS